MHGDGHDGDPQHDAVPLRAEVARLTEALNASSAEIVRLRAERDQLLRRSGSTDATDHARSAEQPSPPLVEFQHRVRNLLAVTKLVFARTVESSADLEEVESHFLGRLDAIGRITTNVLRTAGRGTDLEDLIRDELLTIGVSDGPGLVLQGPPVTLNAEATEGIGLALHELATNALKFGAVKVEGARIEIKWHTDVHHGAPATLHLSWVEQGVPVVTVEPSHHGFGSELILEALPYRLGAETKLDFQGGGIRCSISLPLAESVGGPPAAWR